MKSVFKDLTDIIKLNYDSRAQKALQEIHQFMVTNPLEGFCDTSHYLRVAKTILEWKFDIQTMFAAMLMGYKTFPQNFIYTSKVIEYERINEILEQIPKKYKVFPNHDENPIDLEKFKNCPDALYIIIARQLDLMKNTENFREYDIKMLAEQSRHHFLPILKDIQAYYLVDQFQDLIMKLEQPSLYMDILSRCETIFDENAFSIDNTLNRLEVILTSANMAFSTKKSTIDIQNFIAGIYSKPRAICSIFRPLEKKYHVEDSIDFKHEITKANTALFEITLVIKDICITERPDITPTDVFMEYYTNFLKDRTGIRIISFNQTTGFSEYSIDKSTDEKKGFQSGYFLISDSANNLYRLFLKTETNYKFYILGKLINSKQFYRSNENHIKIYLHDGTSRYIRKGATVLDVAFLIHPMVGLHYHDADINKIDSMYRKLRKVLPNENGQLSPVTTPPQYVLNDGDLVVIKTVPSVITAKLDWFKYLKTEKAIKELVRYFQIEFTRLKSIENQHSTNAGT